MYMIKITEDKLEGLSEHIEQGIRHMGKAMQCVDEWMEENGMGEREGYGNRYGERGNYGNRGGYGSRYGGGSMNQRGGYGMRDDEDWDEMNERDDEMYGERRGRRRRDSRGRYM